MEFLVKIEICRSLIGGIKGDVAGPTIEWMKDELKRVFDFESKVEAPQAGMFIYENKEKIRLGIIGDYSPLFVVSTITHLLSDMEGTEHFYKVEPILEGSYALEEYAESDSIKERRKAALFCKNLYSLLKRW